MLNGSQCHDQGHHDGGQPGTLSWALEGGEMICKLVENIIVPGPKISPDSPGHDKSSEISVHSSNILHHTQKV